MPPHYLQLISDRKFLPLSGKKIMLKGIPGIISPDLLRILAQMGHGDELVISDAHFPVHSINRNVVHADAVSRRFI